MRGSAYLREFGAFILAYGATLLASVLLVTGGHVAGHWVIPVTLAPMIPAAGVCWAVYRQLGRMDELQRRVQLEAFAFAFAGTALLTFSYGFLETAGYPRLPMFAVWPLMATLWMIGGIVSSRRYR